MGSFLSKVAPFGNGIPGPFLAKCSRWWKTRLLLNGTYSDVMHALHKKHGSVVQVGPTEFSIHTDGDLKTRYYFQSLPHHRSLIDNGTMEAFTEQYREERHDSYEPLVQQCNEELLARLQECADTDNTADLGVLTTLYAYEVMIRITTREPAGFLSGIIDPAKSISVLRDWKAQAILYGSYLRYHPWIALVLRVFQSRSEGRFERGDFMMYHPTIVQMFGRGQKANATEGYLATNTEVEACVALSLAAADPAITLITNFLLQVSRHPDTGQRLRAELHESGLWPRAKFRSIRSVSRKLPLWYSHLTSCMTGQPIPRDMGMSYTAPDGGVLIEGRTVELPRGSTITLEPSLFHCNSEFHEEIALKLLTQIFRRFDLVSVDQLDKVLVTSVPVPAPTPPTRKIAAVCRALRTRDDTPSQHTAWSDFQAQEMQKHAYLNTAEGREEQIKKLNAKPFSAPVEIEHTFKERVIKDDVADAPKEAGPKRKAIPPHLRHQAAAADTEGGVKLMPEIGVTSDEGGVML